MTAALTGTPGVGKTSVSEILRNKGYKVLDLNRFIMKKHLRGKKDIKRDTYEVNISELNKAIESKSQEYDIIEGHLSHHLGLSPIIILRCSPDELRRRVETKDWHQAKIEENILAEILDVILQESLEYDEKSVFEIDTTNKTTSEVGDSVHNILEGKTSLYSYGRIDWSEYLD